MADLTPEMKTRARKLAGRLMWRAVGVQIKLAYARLASDPDAGRVERLINAKRIYRELADRITAKYLEGK